METKELLDFVTKDDASIEAKKQTALLEKVVANTTPSPTGPNNNWYTTLRIDMGVAHDSLDVWHSDGDIQANSVVIGAQDIDYWYELEYKDQGPGKKVLVDAGLIMEVTGHDFDRLRITNADTSTEDMRIVVSGVRTF